MNISEAKDRLPLRLYKKIYRESIIDTAKKSGVVIHNTNGKVYK